MKMLADQWHFQSLLRLALSIFLLLAGFCGMEAMAQSSATSGQIVGQVVDTSGAAIGGAEVTARNLNTNYTRNAITSESGEYVIPQLPVGPYEVLITASGFGKASQEILVTLGSSVSANFSVTVEQASEVVVVDGANSSNLNLEPSRSSSQAIINDTQIKDLPANGRRFQDFLLLTPAVSVEPIRNGVSISGQRGINVNINIDGADYNQPFFGGIRGGERSGFAPTVSQEAVQEFQVARNTFSAEFGRSTGAVVNVITKSGTNQFHGSAFYLIRDKELTAEDAFERTSVARQQQFGGSFGGPIRKDKTFFFTAFDFQKVSQPVNVLYSVLDNQRLRNTPGASALLQAAPEGPFTSTNDAQVVLGRIDHQINANNNLSARFNFSNNNAKNATSAGDATQVTTNVAVTNNGLEKDRTYTFVTQLNTIINTKMLNEFRFQFAREDRPRKNNGPGPEVTVLNNGSTISVYGQRSFLPVEQFDDRYQVTDNFSFIVGPHTFKVGGDFNRAFVDQVFRSDAGGIYRFNSLDDYINRRPTQYRQFVGSGKFAADQKELALYIQDEYRVRPGVTINAGFRYEAVFNPDYLKATAPQSRAPQATSVPDDKEEYGPRFGVAWDIGNKGNTVMRLGAGLFYARTPLLLYNQAITNNGGNPEVGFSGILNGTSAINAAFASVGINLAQANLGSLPVFSADQLTRIFTGPAGAPTVAFFDPEFKNPRSTQFNVSLTRQIARGIVVGADFTYINTSRLERLRDVNVGPPVIDAVGRPVYSNPRPNPNFLFIRSQESSARSLYRAGTFSLNIRKSKFVYDFYYTISTNYSDDDNERNFSAIMYDDPFNLRNEYNYSSLDQRHQVSTNALYSLPYGFEISGSGRFTSGAPFSGTVGQDLNRDGQFAAQDRPIFNGQIIKRNTFRNTSFSDISIRLQKGFNLPNERGKLIASIEMFNLLNFDNVRVGTANQIFGPGTDAATGKLVLPPRTFNQLRDNNGVYLKNNIAGPPFQVQVGLRYSF